MVCAPAPPELAEKLDGSLKYRSKGRQVGLSTGVARFAKDCISNRSLEPMCA